MQKQSKQASLMNVVVNPTGGLNYMEAAANLPPEDLQRAFNFIYDINTNVLRTRPGLACVTSAAFTTTSSVPYPIRKVHSYIKSSTESWLVGAIGGQLYQLTSSLWVSTGVTLNDTTTVPGMLTFNGKLLVADGADLKTWDGTTAGIISGTGHPHPTALIEIQSRVVANSAGDLDGVFFSAVEDETTWSGGTSEALRAGYKDGMMVNALAVAPGGNDVIVSKVMNTAKTLYRVNIQDATSANWYAVPVSVNNAAQSNCMITAMNEVYFADTNGFKSLQGVMQYGDLQTALTGRKINNIFQSAPSINEVRYLPLYGSVWTLFTGGRIFVYHPSNGAFTDILFAPEQIKSVCQHGSFVYLGGADGFLYRLDDTTDLDANTYTGTPEQVVSLLESKVFNFPEAAVLRKIKIYLNPYMVGRLNVFAKTSTEEHNMMMVTLPASGELVYDATEDLYGDADEIYDAGANPFFQTSYNRVRSDGISVKVVCSEGAVGVNQIEAEFGLVGGH